MLDCFGGWGWGEGWGGEISGCETTVAVKYFIMHAYMVLALGADPKKIALLFSKAAGRLLW